MLRRRSRQQEKSATIRLAERMEKNPNDETYATIGCVFTAFGFVCVVVRIVLRLLNDYLRTFLGKVARRQHTISVKIEDIFTEDICGFVGFLRSRWGV